MSDRGPNGTQGDGGRHARHAGDDVLDRVEAYWNDLRGDRPVPPRSEVDPRGLGDAIDGVFVIQRMAPAPARIRMAGTYADDLMGMEVRGMPLAALFCVAERPRLGALIEAVFTRPEALRLALASPAEGARPAIRAGLVLLPLLSDLGDATRALGCIAGDATARGAPRRFEIVHAARRDLLSESADRPAAPARLAPPSLSPAAPRPAGLRAGRLRPVPPIAPRPAALAAAPGFAEPGGPSLRPPPRGRPNLRIVGDDEGEGEGDGGKDGDRGAVRTPRDDGPDGAA